MTSTARPAIRTAASEGVPTLPASDLAALFGSTFIQASQAAFDQKTRIYGDQVVFNTGKAEMLTVVNRLSGVSTGAPVTPQTLAAYSLVNATLGLIHGKEPTIALAQAMGELAALGAYLRTEPEPAAAPAPKAETPIAPPRAPLTRPEPTLPKAETPPPLVSDPIALPPASGQ